jgi:hypothetical protein
MDILRKNAGKRYKLDDLESFKNREDRSTLIVYSLFPERFLIEKIAHPDEVKRLAIYLSFESNEGSSCGCKRNIYGSNICKDCFTWDSKYNDTLCSGLTKFHSLETLVTVDLDLSSDLWIEFAQNCTCLRELYITSEELRCYFFYNKDKALDALFQIPTLEKVCINNVYLSYFPPGPSNIKHLQLTRVSLDYDEDNKESNEIYSKNLHTHTNLKTLRLVKGNDIPFNILDLQFDKMPQLEELFLEFEDDVEEKIVTLLPNLKKFHSNFETQDKQKLANSLKRICSLNSNIEEIGINVHSWENKDLLLRLKEELHVLLSTLSFPTIALRGIVGNPIPLGSGADYKSLEKLEIIFVNYT